MDDFDPEQLREFEENLRSMNSSLGTTTAALAKLASQISTLAESQSKSSQQLSKGYDDLSKQVSQESEARKAVREADQEIKRTTEALERSFAKASSAVTDFSAQILSGKEGFSKYGGALSSLGDSTAELTSTMGPLAKGIGIAVDLFTKLAAVMMSQTDMQNQFVKDLNAMGAISGTTSENLTDLARDAGYAASDLEKLTPMLQQASMGLAGFGKGVGDGTKKMLETLKLDDKQEAMMRRYGYTLEEANEAQLFYMQLQRTAGGNLQTQNMTALQLQKRSLAYAKTMRELSELTGKRADELKAEQEIIASDIRNRVRQIADEDELVKIRQQIAKTENGARKDELIQKKQSLENEMKMRADMTVDFGQAGPEFAKSLKNVIEFGGIDESTKSLAVIFSNAGVGVGELQARFKDLEAGSQEYDDAVTQTMDEFSEGVRTGVGQLEQTIGATGPGETEAGQIFGITEENLKAVTLMRDNAQRRNDIEAGIISATEEGADAQKDTASGLQVFERNVRTGADEFLDSINIFNTSINAQVAAMTLLTAAAFAASLSLGKMAAMGGAGTLGKLFGMGGKGGKGQYRDPKTGRFAKAPGMMSRIGTGLAKNAKVVGGGGLLAGAVAVGSAAYERTGAINDIDRNFFDKTQGMDKQSSEYQRAKDEADIEKKGANRKAVGQGAGGAGGALAGAAMGAAIGSAVPIIGTAIGGLIGAGLGAWMGSELGETIGVALSPEEMKAHEATEAEIAMMSSEEREAWQKQYDQAQTAIDLAEKELAETKKLNAENLRLAQDAELYDKDLLGASEINWTKLGELKDGTDEQKEQLKGMLSAILDDNDMRDGDREMIEQQLASLEGIDDNTSPEEETEEKSFATMTQAELYAHFEKVRDGGKPDIADDKKGSLAGTSGELNLADPSVADANGIINVDETITTTSTKKELAGDVPDEQKDIETSKLSSFTEQFADASSSLLGFLRNPLDTIKGMGSTAIDGADATYTQKDIDALPEDQQGLVQVGEKIQDEADSWGKLGNNLLEAFSNSPLALAYQSIDGVMNSAVDIATTAGEQVANVIDAETKIKDEVEAVDGDTTEFAQTTVDGETQSVTEYKETLDIGKQQLAATNTLIAQNERLINNSNTANDLSEEIKRNVQA